MSKVSAFSVLVLEMSFFLGLGTKWSSSSLGFELFLEPKTSALGDLESKTGFFLGLGRGCWFSSSPSAMEAKILLEEPNLSVLCDIEIQK